MDILVGAQNTFGRSLKKLIVDTSGEFTWEFGERPFCYISWMLLGSGRCPSQYSGVAGISLHWSVSFLWHFECHSCYRIIPHLLKTIECLLHRQHLPQETNYVFVSLPHFKMNSLQKEYWCFQDLSLHNTSLFFPSSFSPEHSFSFLSAESAQGSSLSMLWISSLADTFTGSHSGSQPGDEEGSGASVMIMVLICNYTVIFYTDHGILTPLLFGLESQKALI